MNEAEGKVNGHGANGEIIPKPPASLAASPDEPVEQRLAKAEKQIAFRKGILRLIAANIEPGDVTLFGEEGKETIHLTKHACKQILSWAGITVQPDSNIIDKRYEGEEGPYMDFEVWATWLTPDGRYYRTMGNRATFDDFFAKRTRYTCPKDGCGAVTDYEKGCPHHGKVRSVKQTYYLPLTEVDIPAIKQAAITNLWNHIVDDAGLKPSLRELLDAGFKFNQAAARINFGAQKAKQAPPVKQEASPKDAAAATPQTAPAAASSPKQDNGGVPRAQIPKSDLSVGKGIISNVEEKTTKPGKKSKGGNPYLLVTQNGHFLYCFANHEVETLEGKERVFGLIKESLGQFCEFVIETKGSEKPMHMITGAHRIGRHAWENGEPVRPEGYQATDGDIPF